MIETFGTFEGQDVFRATLRDGDVAVSILNYGAVTQNWQIPVNGHSTPMVLGFDQFDNYPAHSRSFGIIAGRVANRTAKGRFELEGTQYQLSINNGPNHLHGGTLGLGRRIWDMEPDGEKAVQLRYHSPDGEEGYPGAVEFEVTVRLEGATVTYDMGARPDRPTPINLAQHNYYCLSGSDVLDHEVRLAASHYTPVDADLIPTGHIESVASTHFDFRRGGRIGDLDPERLGIDLNFVLDEGRDPAEPFAQVSAPNGVRLRAWSDQPGVQVFDAPQMDIPVAGLGGRKYGAFAGLCLEAQKFPDALNVPAFPSVIATPDQPYRQRTAIEIAQFGESIL